MSDWLFAESWLYLQDGVLNSDIDGTRIMGQTAVSNNEWHHAAVTYDGSTLTLYLDGQVEQQTDNITHTISLPIFALGATSNSLTTSLDEVIVFDKELTADEVYALAQRDVAGINKVELRLRPAASGLLSGTVTYLPFAELAGATQFEDVSFYNNDATCTNCPTAQASGQNGYSAQFDGIDDSLIISDDVSLDLNHYTIAFWVNPNQSKPDWMEVLAKESVMGGDRSYGFHFAPNTTQLWFGSVQDDCSSWAAILGALTPLPANTWSHVAATYDGSTISLYINGEVVASTAYSGAICQNNHPIRIGGASDNYDELAGQLDEVYIVSRALTAAEIVLLADVGDSGEAGLRATPSSTLEGWQSAILNQASGSRLTGWQHTLPDNVEGFYELDSRTTDEVGNMSQSNTGWRGIIDTKAPRVTISGHFVGGGSAAQTEYSITFTDLFLDETSFNHPCNSNDVITFSRTDPITSTIQATATCRVLGHQTNTVEAQACDMAGHCTTEQLTLSNPVNVAGVVILSPTQQVPTGTIPIGGGAFAPNGISAVSVLVNGVQVGADSFDGVITDTLWSVDWTATATGTFTVTAVLTDSLNNIVTNTATIQVETAAIAPYVTAAPTANKIDLELTWQTSANNCSYNIYTSLTPYATPETSYLVQADLPANTTQATLVGYYAATGSLFNLVEAISCSGFQSAVSNETAVFPYPLEPGD